LQQTVHKCDVAAAHLGNDVIILGCTVGVPLPYHYLFPQHISERTPISDISVVGICVVGVVVGVRKLIRRRQPSSR
jgi:hypothetical protein